MREHRVGQLFEIERRGHLAAELHQSASVIVTVFVVETVHEGTHAITQWLKKKRREKRRQGRNGRYFAACSLRKNDLYPRNRQQEVHYKQQQRGDRVDHAALDDDIDIHQPVLEESISERDGN